MREWAAADERRHEIGKSAARLDYVIRLQQEGRFPEARLVLGRVSDVGSEELHGKIAQAHADLKLAERLDAIRLRRATCLGHQLALVRSEEDYEAAFRDAGLGGLDDARVGPGPRDVPARPPVATPRKAVSESVAGPNRRPSTTSGRFRRRRVVWQGSGPDGICLESEIGRKSLPKKHFSIYWTSR
jgi:hypothetical protein